MKRLLFVAIYFISSFASTSLVAQERYVVDLRNGMRLGPGSLETTDSVSANLFQKTATSEAGGGGILKLNDGWRRTYFNASSKNVSGAPKLDNQVPFEPIRLPAYTEVNRNGNKLTSVNILRVEEFKPTGRRSLKVVKGSNDTIEVLQQITELTPEYAKMELLRGGDDKFTWDSREALTSIPSDQLHAILEHHLDLTKPAEWQRMYRFYIEANRFSEAIAVLTEGIRRFPSELGQRKNLIAQAHQLQANKQFEEIDIRLKAGQSKLAYQLLRIMSPNLLETKISAKNQLDELRVELERVQQIAVGLKERVNKLPETDKQAIQPILDELLKDELNIDTANRLDDYYRLQSNSSAPNENMVALAVGGWILGPGSGIQNFAVAKSLVNVRKLVKDYLAEPSQPGREQILNKLRSEEGGQPQYVAKVLQIMKPPLPLPAAVEKDPPGFYRLEVKLPNGNTVNYTVQLPPEYDPNRQYPCILALPSTQYQHQVNIPIDFWCGSLIDREGLDPQRFGAASRFGYVVISPNWLTGQESYQYTEGEKLRVLACYRDALRRISINTDKVFITGHFEGATAAWDIAQSHPDLWAGAIMLSPTADKYIVHYHENIQAQTEFPEQIPLATYIVYGELDIKLERYLGITSTADRYLKNNLHDGLLVEYIGQEAGLFSPEVPRIFQWMQLSTHQRVRVPKKINCVSLRSGDRFFYWLEAPRLSNENSTNAFQFAADRAGRFEAAILDPSLNGIRVSKIPSQDRNARIWLTPEMVDFGRDVVVMMRDKKSNRQVSGKIEVMLEDVRTRGDRQHFFWDYIDTSSR